jgi:cytidine deaminase
MDFPVEKLINIARAARDKAYAPYSNFPVGAALITLRGQIYKGCNIENASYGLTVCAERIAVFKAVSEGERDFAALAVIAGGENYCFPCGACLQVFYEFCPRCRIFICNNQGEFQEKLVTELLPYAFQIS